MDWFAVDMRENKISLYLSFPIFSGGSHGQAKGQYSLNTLMKY